MTQTIILGTKRAAEEAVRVVLAAPPGSVLEVKAPRRTNDQNALMWSRLSDISRAKPDGRMHPPEVWKLLMMHACGWAVQFEMGLNGQPFPVGYRSSRLTKEEMGQLLDFIDAYAAEHGIEWSFEKDAA